MDDQLLPQVDPESFNGFMALLAPLVRLLTRLGVSPKFLTIAGVVITTAGAVSFFLKSPRLGGFLILLAASATPSTGLWPANAGKATRFGALLDSSVDRYSEFVMLFASADIS